MERESEPVSPEPVTLRCRSCGRLIDVSRPGPEHDIVYRLNSTSGPKEPVPYLVLHSPWSAA